MKEFWDFDENNNYYIVNIQGKKYKVLNIYKNYFQAAEILNYIYKIIYSICQYLTLNINRYSKSDQKYITCFCEIHPFNYLLSEMQLNTPFNGLNKPKNIIQTSKEKIGKDVNLRAQYRDIFLTLRNSNGTFKDFNTIMKLAIHEIAHSMCNHVKWRDDDHGKDFQNAEKIITNAYNNIIKN
jgi:predicted metal-dependent peptidase